MVPAIPPGFSRVPFKKHKLNITLPP